MPQTTSTQNPVPTLVFEAQEWNDFTRPSIQRDLAQFALSFTLYGMYILLCGASIYSLLRPNDRNRKTTLILSLALLVLFTSTTIYTVVACLQILEDILSQVINSIENLWTVSSGLWPITDFNGGPSLPWLTTETSLAKFVYCAPTATLTINIILGDAIVCWRACTLWQGNRTVTGACLTLLLTTFALGIADTTYACQNNGSWNPDPNADGNGSLYEGFSYGVAATALSLTTNLFATVIVAVKTWISRRMLKRYVATGPMVSQMEKVLSLLVESGTIYCALWVVVLAWQAGVYKANLLQVPGNNDFWEIFAVIMNGALVPLISMYPTIIIVVVALNRSHIENGFTKPTQSSIDRLPLPLLTATVNTTVTTCCESQLRDRSDRALLIGEQDFQSGDGTDGSSTYSAEEQKLGYIV